MMKRALGLLLWSVMLAFAACGGTKHNSATTTSASGAARSSTTAVDAPELPQFSSKFDRVCTTQVGFPGAASYESAAGLHPVILFEEYRGKSYVSSSRTLPQGWTVKEDADFNDNSELKAVQLVACSDRVKESPTGKMCDFEDKGDKVKLELVDATYDLTIYAATSGKQVQKSTLEAKTTDCPYIAAFQKGDTTFVSQPSDDQYIAALKPVIAP